MQEVEGDWEARQQAHSAERNMRSRRRRSKAAAGGSHEVQGVAAAAAAAPPPAAPAATGGLPPPPRTPRRPHANAIVEESEALLAGASAAASVRPSSVQQNASGLPSASTPTRQHGQDSDVGSASSAGSKAPAAAVSGPSTPVRLRHGDGIALPASAGGTRPISPRGNNMDAGVTPEAIVAGTSSAGEDHDSVIINRHGSVLRLVKSHTWWRIRWMDVYHCSRSQKRIYYVCGLDPFWPLLVLCVGVYISNFLQVMLVLCFFGCIILYSNSERKRDAQSVGDEFLDTESSSDSDVELEYSGSRMNSRAGVESFSNRKEPRYGHLDDAAVHDEMSEVFD